MRNIRSASTIAPRCRSEVRRNVGCDTLFTATSLYLFPPDGDASESTASATRAGRAGRAGRAPTGLWPGLSGNARALNSKYSASKIIRFGGSSGGPVRDWAGLFPSRAPRPPARPASHNKASQASSQPRTKRGKSNDYEVKRPAARPRSKDSKSVRPPPPLPGPGPDQSVVDSHVSHPVTIEAKCRYILDRTRKSSQTLTRC